MIEVFLRVRVGILHHLLERLSVSLILLAFGLLIHAMMILNA